MPPQPPTKRSLGQNFLINVGVRDKIRQALAPTPADCIVELGPGSGLLTAALLPHCARLVAVELDQRLAAELPERVGSPATLAVVVQDAVGFDYEPHRRQHGQRLLVAGNLPYNAATAILRSALEQAGAIERLVLMFQREVALRLVADPGSRRYGLLSVVTQQRAQVTKLFDVAPGSFHPPPRVRSAVVEVIPRREGVLDPCCMRTHDQLLRAAFAQRRKTLANNLKAQNHWDYDRLEKLLGSESIDPRTRADRLSVATWARLAVALCDCPRTD